MPEQRWAYLYFDGSAQPNPGAGGAGWVLHLPGGGERGEDAEEGNVQMIQTLPANFSYEEPSRNDVTNNEAEYVGLLCGLSAALKARVRNLVVRGDSELVVKQCLGEYECRSEKLRPLHEAALLMLSCFNSRLEAVPREQNTQADALANRGRLGQVRTDRTTLPTTPSHACILLPSSFIPFGLPYLIVTTSNLFRTLRAGARGRQDKILAFPRYSNSSKGADLVAGTHAKHGDNVP